MAHEKWGDIVEDELGSIPSTTSRTLSGVLQEVSGQAQATGRGEQNFGLDLGVCFAAAVVPVGMCRQPSAPCPCPCRLLVPDPHLLMAACLLSVSVGVCSR